MIADRILHIIFIRGVDSTNHSDSPYTIFDFAPQGALRQYLLSDCRSRGIKTNRVRCLIKMKFVFTSKLSVKKLVFAVFSEYLLLSSCSSISSLVRFSYREFDMKCITSRSVCPSAVNLREKRINRRRTQRFMQRAQRERRFFRLRPIHVS